MNKYLVTFEGRAWGSTSEFSRVCGEVLAENPEKAMGAFVLSHYNDYGLLFPLHVDLRREGL